ncbi:MAG: TetR/AcrR family transcriptional regulator [Pseudomonadota bacterium]
MQEKSSGQRNEARAAATKLALMEAGKALFIAQGYAETGTPQIVKEAGVTRGALYHHFDGKAGLLRAIVAQEMHDISREVEARAIDAASPRAALLAGAEAYFDAMADAGRQRLILRDGPAILGPADMARLDAEAGAGGLADGLAALMGEDAPSRPVLEALADIVSAGFDRAAQRGSTSEYRQSMTLMFDALSQDDAPIG